MHKRPKATKPVKSTKAAKAAKKAHVTPKKGTGHKGKKMSY